MHMLTYVRMLQKNRCSYIHVGVAYVRIKVCSSSRGIDTSGISVGALAGFAPRLEGYIPCMSGPQADPRMTEIERMLAAGDSKNLRESFFLRVTGLLIAADRVCHSDASATPCSQPHVYSILNSSFCSTTDES